MYGFVVKKRFWSQTDVGLNPDSLLPSRVTLSYIILMYVKMRVIKMCFFELF